ncbi:nucleotide exchange factor GrpE [Prosthecochloris sp. GSB1]|uniref:nucleotide exchange factor GrpE n=1 Tax=Prosthecochloris sp. GSB1 TaxID=281093 RepID=UPI000B8C9516|nr:nucleotide exchange factor GrpE [Prosthecochloris sp. GSB1]ASQ90090.1 nucleotide exchange factor GrpE [Prosthecochloris sp. GSB1]
MIKKAYRKDDAEVKKEEQVGETSEKPTVSEDGEQASRAAGLLKELEEARAQSETLREQLVRKVAEFENFRKQKDREASMAGSRTLENVIRELLPVIDDVNRIVDHAPEILEKSDEARPYVDGVRLLQKNLMKWLSDKGVQRIEALGKKMDVNFHEAITQIDHPEAEPETVVEEYQAGYALGDRVIRHAKVVVAR